MITFLGAGDMFIRITSYINPSILEVFALDKSTGLIGDLVKVVVT
jgi:hypothetical protein